MIREKIEQARGILAELDIDLWLTFVRESANFPDPALEMVVRTNVTWQSAFLIPREGPTLAIVGSLDRPNMEAQEVFDHVEGYVEGLRAPLVEALRERDPKRIAINYSQDIEIADGLTHGMYLNLVRHLGDTPYAERLCSSAPIIARLRGRKTAAEAALLQAATVAALEIFDEVGGFLRPGLTEKEVAAFMTERVLDRGLELAWDPAHCPAVFSGPDTAGAHAEPTERVVQAGHVLNIDFGVRKDGYCSDLQRTYYLLREGETAAPAEVQRGFEVIHEAVHRAAAALKPGVAGWEIDAVARDYIVSEGYPEYQHALGHQIGRMAHDGAELLGPRWERYGTRVTEPVEEGQVYTIEPRLPIPGYGIATIEEMVQVTADGCTFLSAPQEELILVRG